MLTVFYKLRSKKSYATLAGLEPTRRTPIDF
jgi:hypothetical protein